MCLSSAMRLGIDFGTTRTVVATADRGNYPVVAFTDLDGDIREWIPTIAAEQEGQLVFGFAAERVAEKKPEKALRGFKRLLSRAEAHPEQSVKVGTMRVSLSGLVAGFLSYVRRSLSDSSNLPFSISSDELVESLVSVPANAHNVQRLITLDAFGAAGFRVLSMLNEPSAAAVEYAHRYARTITKNRQNVVIYDLGGGTFDTSLISMENKEYTVLASQGVAALGGEDFDRILAEQAAKKAGFSLDKLKPRFRGAFIETCRGHKEALTPNARQIGIDLGCLARAELPGAKKKADESVTLKVAGYYSACDLLLRETLLTLRRTIDVVGIDQIAGIHVVGGGSALPVVGRRLRELYGHRVHRSPYASCATALGLAIAGDEVNQVEVHESLGREFGVFREGADGSEVSFDRIFPAGTSLAEAQEEVRQYRPAHNLGRFRFVECSRLENGSPAGDIAPRATIYFPFQDDLRREKNLRAVPIRRLDGPGPLTEERYSINREGIVELTIRDLETGYENRSQLLGPVQAPALETVSVGVSTGLR